MNWPGRNWLGAIRTATGGIRRHKMQAIVIAMVLLVSTASATLGLTLLAASNTPFVHAFGAQRGADVSVTVNAAHASSAALAATGRLGGVTAAAGRSASPRSRRSPAASRSGRSRWSAAPHPAARSTTWC